ncbi:MAG: phage major capsid protein [Planctomycetota bacterium]
MNRNTFTTTGLATISLLMAMGPMNDAPRQRPSYLTAEDDPQSAWAVLHEDPDNRNLRQIDMVLGEIKDEFDQIMAINRSDRTERQQARLNTLTNRATKLKVERGQLEATAGTTGRDIDNALRCDGPGNTEWTDDAGRPVRVLSNTQRLTAHNSFAPAGQDPMPGAEGVRVGNMLRGALTGDWRGAEAERDAWNLSTDSGGSVMLPESIGSQIIDLARSGSAVIRAGAGTIPMTSPKMRLVKITGDPVVAGVAENAEIPESDPTIAGINFTAKKQGVLVRVSRELLFDSPNSGSMIEGLLRTIMGAKVDEVALSGDGVGANPLGILNTAGVNDVAVGGAPDWDDFLDAAQAIEEANGMPATSVMSPGVKGFLNKLKDTEGRYLSPPPSLQDMTKLTSTKLDDTVATMGDFSKVLIGVWRDVEIALSGFAKDAFEKDQVLFRVLWRGDVAVTQPGHLAKLTGIALS